jgi:uncharacterized protein
MRSGIDETLRVLPDQQKKSNLTANVRKNGWGRSHTLVDSAVRRPITMQEDRFVTTSARKLFVNLAVRELDKSKAFFGKLGFQFNPDFTDDNAASMIVSDQAFVMLLAEPFFKGFTKRQIADTSTSTEALLAVSCDSRDEVDALAQTAIDAGGTPAMDPQDHGFMYVRSFYDLDGHHWEIFWMDPAAQKPS